MHNMHNLLDSRVAARGDIWLEFKRAAFNSPLYLQLSFVLKFKEIFTV
jgi:hypothetical protein